MVKNKDLNGKLMAKTSNVLPDVVFNVSLILLDICVYVNHGLFKTQKHFTYTWRVFNAQQSIQI